jgi:hypothetical protein
VISAIMLFPQAARPWEEGGNRRIALALLIGISPSSFVGLDPLSGGSEPGNQPLPVFSPGSCWCSGTCAGQAGSGSACSCPCHPGYCPLPPRNRGNSSFPKNRNCDKGIILTEASPGCSHSLEPVMICDGSERRSSTSVMSR